MRGDAGEAGLRLLEVPEHRVAEDLVASARLAARIRARLGSRRLEVDQLLGVRHRQRAQQHLVEQRENRRIRANSKRQRQDRDQRDERRLEQGAQGKTEVGHNRRFDETDGSAVRYLTTMEPTELVGASIWLVMIILGGSRSIACGRGARTSARRGRDDLRHRSGREAEGDRDRGGGQSRRPRLRARGR